MTSEERRRKHGDRKRLGELKREQQKESKKRKVLKLEDWSEVVSSTPRHERDSNSQLLL
jgi:hypothetical protein